MNSHHHSPMIAFGGAWSVGQIQSLIKLRYKDFANDFNKSTNDNNQEIWDRFLKKWNSMQDYEIFSLKNLRNKLRSLCNEYSDIANILDVISIILI